MKKNKWKDIIAKFILVSFIVPAVYAIYKIVVSPISNINNIEGLRIKSDYVLMLTQCIIAIIGMLLPSIISKNRKIIIPHAIYLAFVIFIYASMFLGEMRNFYYKIPHWDTILHAFSGVMLGAVGFSFVNLLNKKDEVYFKLSPIFVAIFAFCFAITLGCIWEIFEFSFDGILKLNMQKFALENGTQLLGREAVLDTMEDLIVDCIGAGTMSIIGYISLKYKKGWIEKILIRKAFH